MLPLAPPLRPKASSQSLTTTSSNATTPQLPSAQQQQQQDFFQSMFPAGGDPTDPSSSGDPASDPFAALMKAMQGGGEGGAGAFPGMPPGMGGFGEGQEPGSSLFPPGMMMPPSLEPEYSTKKTFADRMFTIAHLLGVLALVVFVIGWWEPRVMELKRAGLMDV